MKTKIKYRKTIITVIAMFVVILSVSAQDNKTKEKEDSIKFNLGDYNVYMIKDSIDIHGHNRNIKDSTKKKDNFEIYWAGIGLGVNGYLNANNDTKVPTGYDFLELNYPKSINVTINFLEEKIPLWKKHINIVTGMGLDINNYRFSSKHYVLQPNTPFISAEYDSTLAFNSKLAVTYLNVPLLLQFDTKSFGEKQRTMHISCGIVGGLRLWSHTKQVYEINGTKYKTKTKDDFNLNPFPCSAMVRIGYGNIDLYASYSLNGMFKNGQGPQLYPFTVGITLLGF